MIFKPKPIENIYENSNKKTAKKPIIIADIHEKNSLVISELVDLGINIEFKKLQIADFIIGKTAIERKTVSDFLNSMISKRLFFQLRNLKKHPKNLLIIEGTDEHILYNDTEQGIHGNAVRGFLLSILLEHQIPIIFTKDYKDTAKFLSVLAKKSKKPFSLNIKRKSLNKKEQLQFILEGFPGIGPQTSKKLLKKYKSIKSVINQDIENLKKVIGKKADIFKELIDREY